MSACRLDTDEPSGQYFCIFLPDLGRSSVGVKGEYCGPQSVSEGASSSISGMREAHTPKEGRLLREVELKLCRAVLLTRAPQDQGREEVRACH